MVTARPSDVIHVTLTDHLIRRKKPANDPAAPRAEQHPKRTRLEIRPYFPKRAGKNPRYPLFKGFGEAYFATAESNAAWRAAFEQTKPHPVAAYVTIGRGLLEVGDVAGATELLNEAVQKFPDDATARWTLGEALLRGNHATAAVAALEEAARRDRREPGIQGALGEAYWRAGAHEKARAAYARALQARPESAGTWRAYGRLLLQLDDPDAALQALQTAIRWNPHDAYSYGLASSIHASQRRTAAQFRVLEQGASLLLDIKLELIAARFLTRDKEFRDPKGGLALATRVARDQPKNPRALLYHALAILFEGKTTDAPGAIHAARTAGADTATCTALSILYWKLRRDQTRIDLLLPRLETELRQPSTERLRPQLLAHLRGLKIR
jgi:tetratricopeptide (TPR) repeat protein